MQVQSVADYEAVRKDPTNAGKTFSVSKDVFEHYMNGITVTQVTAQEVSEINALLGTSIANTDLVGLTRVSTCGECGHALTFADHVRIALNMSAHAQHELVKFIVGTDYYLTVDTDKKRDIVCPQCKKPTVVIHCCYSTNRYGYV